jgi:hypothetical protein
LRRDVPFHFQKFSVEISVENYMKITVPTTTLVRGEILKSTSWRCLGLQQQLLDVSLVA